ncbi:lytic transglycosylase domain-containing protein [Filobacillus milosensis]|uniref:Lytic transglycosylase domain-containing protein n=2 Tax=Filobacillus milosensis TaxID=94137 RepID=A0A4Y8IFC4_9BACI|nr:lytic transglycosylase domain-containing protein [Filobacillus milosensis]
MALEKESIEKEYKEWKKTYQNRLNEMEIIIAANSKENEDVQLVSMDKNDVGTIHYTDWIEKKKFAEIVYEDSEGRFKKDWGMFLHSKAIEKSVDPFVAYELLKIETGGTFDPDLVGPDTKYGNARGIAQIMHSNTAEWLASMAGLEYKGKEMLFDPYYSMELSVVYLDFLYRRYGNWAEALTAYNRGMGGLEKYKLENGHAQSSYATTVIEGTKNFR